MYITTTLKKKNNRMRFENKSLPIGGEYLKKKKGKKNIHKIVTMYVYIKL